MSYSKPTELMNAAMRKRLFSRLNGFHQNEKYVDVTIQCDNTNFKCHRWLLASASTYFDDLFSKESDLYVVPDDVDAATFGQVVQFLYTGDLVITVDNVEKLVRTSVLLGMEDLEKACIPFISENINHINVLDMFIFASTKGNDVLVNMFGRSVSTKDLDEFFKRDGHCELSFEVFAMILKRWKLTPHDAINRWINYSEEERRKHFDALTKVHGQFISSFRPVLHLYIRYERYDAMPTEDRPAVKCTIFGGIKAFNIFHQSPSSSAKCSFVGDIGIPNCAYIDSPVVVDDSLDESRIYYIRNKPEGALCPDNDLVSCSSAAMHPFSIVKAAAPVLLHDCSLCYISNQGIFLYNSDYHKMPNSDRERGAIEISWDEILRGIFFYNIETDRWFPLPSMKRHAARASMVALNNMLYLIGGEEQTDIYDDYGSSAEPMFNYVQAYDHRVGTWSEMPKSKLNYLENGKCCVLNGKIYRCGAGTSGQEVERYDPVAAKWEKLESANFKVTSHSHLASYGNKLWLVNHYRDSQRRDQHDLPNWPVTDLSIDLYDPLSGKWTISAILRNASQRYILKSNYYSLYNRETCRIGTAVTSLVFNSSNLH